MLHIRLEDALRTGRWGPLQLPATRADVQAALGLPEVWMPPQPIERSSIWRYGVIELHFSDNQGPGDDCWMIYTDNVDALDEPTAAFVLDASILSAEGLAACARRLVAAGIPCEQGEARYGGRLLVTRPGFTLQFDGGRLSALFIKDPAYRNL